MWLSAWAVFLVLVTWCSACVGVVADLSAKVRWLGMFFQLTGVFIVFMQLNNSLRAFGLSLSLLKMVVEFLIPIGRWIGRRIKDIVFRLFRKTENLRADLLTGSAPIAGPAPIVSDGSLEDRVTMMEAIVKELQQDFCNFRDKTIQTFEIQRKNLQALDKDLRDLLKEVIIGDIHLSLAGPIYLAIGIILATVPGEIAWGLQRIGFSVYACAH